MRSIARVWIGIAVMLLAGCASMQRKFLFFPSHHARENGLTAWTDGGKLLGYSRVVESPENIWLMLHGNGGQASDRDYAIPSFSARDSVFILEYPGYGAREGKPSRAAFDAAAAEAYNYLRKTFPGIPLGVVGESIGSGPACALASQPMPPDKIVLIVPFDSLKSVAQERVRIIPVGLLLEANWDNIRALSNYKGPVDVFGAQQDRVIPVAHAKKLADSVPTATFHPLQCGHNEWSRKGLVKIRNP